MILENIILFGGVGNHFFLTTNKLKKRLELEWEKHIFFKDKTDFFIENIDTFFLNKYFFLHYAQECIKWKWKNKRQLKVLLKNDPETTKALLKFGTHVSS